MRSAKPPPIDDVQLVKGCRQNDRFHQEMLYRKYVKSMMRMCLRHTNDQAVALEIVNNGFLRVFQKIDHFSATGSLEGWIRKLVFHALSDYFKKNAKSIRFLSLEDWDQPKESGALSNLYFEDLIQLLDQVPEASRRVFYLFAIEGFSHPEIAQELEISVGTSKWHLATARKELKQMILKQSNFQEHAR